MMNEENLIEGFQYRKGWIGTPYVLENADPKLDIDDETLVIKPNFHMSIFSVKKYAAQIAQETGQDEPEVEKHIIEEAKQLLQTNPVTIGELRDEFRLALEGEKKTVVVMCEAKGLEDFFNGMRQALKIDIPAQPTHITLYTRDGGAGIGLASEEEVRRLTRLLTTAESELVKKAIKF